MIEYLPEAGYGRSIDLRSNKTVGQRGRHTPISNKARTVVRVNQTRMMQGRAKKEKRPMTEEIVCVGVDIAKNILDVAVSNLNETRQFDNDYEGITQAVRYIAGLKPTMIILVEETLYLLHGHTLSQVPWEINWTTPIIGRMIGQKL